MAYVNVGAFISGQRPKSKKALKEAMRDAPESVTFDCTAFVGPDAGRADIKGTEIPESDKLSVTGPDPYTTRNWYGTVEITPKGTVRVS